MPRPSMIDDPEHWRRRAQESRDNANRHDDPDVKKTLLDIAESYEQLAMIAEQRGTLKAG
jgi:hypothetical protein